VKNFIIWILTLFILSSCGEDAAPIKGEEVTLAIAHIDRVPPTITFQSTPSNLTGGDDYTLNFTIEDDLEGYGIHTAELYYSPDGVEGNYKLLADVKNKNTFKLCTPNKSHPQPTFKIMAKDAKGNETIEYLGNDSNKFNITLMAEPPMPNISSSEGSLTNQSNVDILIDACTKNYCDSDAVYYEPSSNNLFIAVNGTQPLAGDVAWKTCDDVLANGETTPNFITDGNSTFNLWVKSEDTDFDNTPIINISTANKDVTVTYDSIPPDPTGLFASGTTLTASSIGKYKISDCTDIEKVLINKITAAPPLATELDWQNCSDVLTSLQAIDFVPGNNDFYFWLKDEAENVTPTYLDFSTNYTPPTITVVGGPTITTPDASMTIQWCEEAGITHVLFNETGTVPLSSAGSWQTCSKDVGAMSYGKLSPGPTTMKAFFKYDSGVIAPNPIDVPVFYSPQLAWVETPTVSRPKASFTLFSCEGISAIYFNQSTIPGASDLGWQPCSLIAGALTHSGFAQGAQTLNVWFKDALNNVYGDNTTINVTYTPPSTTVKDAPTITTPNAYLTMNTCQYIQEVLTTVDDATVPTSGTPGWTTCSSANYAHQSPVLTEGAHTLRTWFKFYDGDILTVSADHVINYDAPDLTPPPLVIGDGADLNITSTLVNGDASGPPELVVAADSRADFTINSCDPIAVGTEDDIAEVIVTTTNVQPAVGSADWQACTTVAGAIQSASLPDGNNDVYIWYKDLNDNITTVAQAHNFDINTVSDMTPPPRPLVTVENAPILASAPAELTIADCTDVDQVFFNIGGDLIPDKGAEGWDNCSIATGAIKYPITIAGNYTLQAWFKDAAGNINPTPRNVSFIFTPVPSTLPEPVATWSMDQNHFYNGLLVDIRGDHNLKTSYIGDLVFATAKVKEGLDFTGPNTVAITKISNVLKPTVSISVGVWAYLTNADASTQTIIGNASSGTGYSLTTQASELRFSVNGNIAKVATTSYTTGWHYITGISDGSTIKLFIDGFLEDTFTFGAPQNIAYGCATIFAIGGSVNGCTDNVDAGSHFTGKIDEVNIWNVALTDEEAFDLYVDNSNDFKVNMAATLPADIADASFFGAHEQTALMNVVTCGDAEFIYMNETTHPPLPDDPTWQPCNSTLGGHHLGGLSQGYHELKVWAKDQFDNISASYQKVDTTIESMFLSPVPVLYWNLDNTHLSGTDLFSIYSLHDAENHGAQTGVASIQKEGALFTKAETDFIEVKHATASMIGSNFSVSIWADITNNDSRTQTLVGNRIGNDGYSIEIDNANGELRFIVGTGATTREIGVLTTFYPSGFHNIVATYDGQNAEMYIDGTSVVANDFGSSVDVSYGCLSNLTIGAGATCNTGAAAGSHFDNNIDEVIVFNSVLTGLEIDNLFNGSDTIPPLPVVITPKNNTYTINIPVAKLNSSNCSDISEVYIALDAIIPAPDAANWQSCATSGDTIESTNLAIGVNNLKVWFKDAAGNVSASSTDIAMTYNYDFTIPAPDSFWPFDDVTISGATAYDVTGSNEGTIFNTTMDVTGVSYEGLNFNGTNAYMKADFDASLQPTDKVTLSAWINVAAWPTATEYIAGNLNGGGYALLLGNNTIEWHVKANGIIQTVSVATGAYPAGSDYMVTGVYDDGVLRLFVNDTEVQQLDLTVDYLIEYDNSNAFTVATQSGVTVDDIPGVGYFSGSIDEVTFWREAMTDTVVDEMYVRGQNGDKNYYDVLPPTIPVTADIIYYNALVSRANVTVTDCTGIHSMLIGASTFPPDKNDEDWQLCNTLTGGTLSKELKPEDSFGKLWVKDEFGNISKSFKYVPIVTLYDKPIARPIVHWTFDNAHYNSGTRLFLDRIAGAELIAERVNLVDIDPSPSTVYNIPYDGTATGMTPGKPGVLNESFRLGSRDFTRCDDCEVTKPSEAVSISTWVYISNGYSDDVEHVASTLLNGKGYGLKFRNNAPIGARVLFEVHTANGDTLAPYLETTNIASAWHLVTGTYDGQVATLYMDGIFVKSFSAPAPSPIEYEPGVKFTVGSGPTTGTMPNDYSLTDTSLYETYASGDIDEVLIWDQALSGLMVSSLYHNGADILYSSDTTEPALPVMSQENQRDTMFDNTVYATASTCSDVSGILVNEGTQPDKQDTRWEICRTRAGSYRYDLTYDAGHTVTFWVKDLAGNVSSTSSDVVVNYISNPLPIANAYWPLDEENFVDQFALDTISSDNIHNMYVHDFNRDMNPTATFAAGKQGDSMMMNNTYLSSNMTSLLRPINELTASGWFYLTNGDTSSGIFIDNQREEGTSANTRGYKIFKSGGNITFRLGLDILDRREISAPLSAYPTGWHLITGVFNNDTMKLYVDATEVASYTLPEPDYINYNSYTTRLVFGAESNASSRPGTFFNEKIDEVAIWGLALTPAQITDVFNKGNSGDYLFDMRFTNIDVNNAYIYHYDNFESRVRMTFLDCTDTPYVFVGPDSLGAPDPKSDDWHMCSTKEGAIFSSKLDNGTQYVRAWSKNIYGDVSTGYATHEIPVITETSDIVLPKFFWDFNSEHRTSGRTQEIRFGADLTFTDSYYSQQGFLQDDGLKANGSGSATSSSYFHDNGYGETISFWTELTNSDASSHNLYSQGNTLIYQSGGYLTYRVYRSLTQSYDSDIATTYGYASINLAKVPTGKHFVTATYDGKIMKLYLNSVLWFEKDVAEDRFQADAFHRLPEGITSRVLGSSSTYTTKHFEDLMVFQDVLTQTEIEAHYNRLAKIIYPADVTPPATTPTISLSQSVFSVGKWPTNDQDTYLTIDDCSDIAGVFVSVGNASQPSKIDIGWQKCVIEDGAIKVPDLTVGDNNIYIWYKDSIGNVTAVADTIIIDYTIDALPDPVAYWSFDQNTIFNNVAFETMSQNNAELLNYNLTTGKVGEAFRGDTNRNVGVVRSDSTYKPTEEISISFWTDKGAVCTDADNASDTILSTMNGDNTGYKITIDTLTNSGCSTAGYTYLKMTFHVSLDGARRTSHIPYSYLGGGLSHIVITYDGRKIKWFINNVLAHTDDQGVERSITYTDSDTPLLIGTGFNSGAYTPQVGNYFGGTIDELAIFDKALVLTQVNEINSRANSVQKVHDDNRAVITPLNTVGSVYLPGTDFAYGDRIKATISDCTDMDLVLVTDSLVQPADTDSNWQVCSTLEGAILSAPITTGSVVTPRLWAKSFEGERSSASGTLNGATVNLLAGSVTVDRPNVIWTFNETPTGHINATDFFDPFYYHSTAVKGIIPSGAEPTATSNVDPNDSVQDEAFDFDGVNDYLIHGVTGNNTFHSNYSISLWAHLTNGDSQSKTILSNKQRGATNDGGIQIHIENNLLKASIAFNASDSQSFSNKTLTAEYSNLNYSTGFRNIVVTFDGLILALYLDGILVADNYFSFYGAGRVYAYNDYSTPWIVGAEVDAGGLPQAGTYFNSVIDEVTMWSSALSATQITNLFNYGAQFIPANTGDGLAPTDPGIELADNQTVVNIPFAGFNIPACTGANGQKINAIYIGVQKLNPDDPIPAAPENLDPNWIYCTTDEGKIISDLLNEGESRLHVYYKDEEGDISTPYTFDVTYVAPNMPNPRAYYDFEPANWNNTRALSNVNYLDVRNADGDYTGGLVGSRSFLIDSSTDPIDRTHIQALELKDDFAVSFWVYSMPYDGRIMYIPNILTINKNASDNLSFSFNSSYRNYAGSTKGRLIPNQWNHVIFSKSDSVVSLHLNGAEENSVAVQDNLLREQSGNWRIGEIVSRYDEVAFYNQKVNKEQALYLYYLGKKNLPLPASQSEIVTAPIADNYYQFNDSDIVTTTLNDQGKNPVDMTIVNAVTTGDLDAKIGESFSITRFEDVLEDGDNNILGPPEYLEGNSPLQLGSEFTISTWVKFTRGVSHENEVHMVLSQWGETNDEQSFRLYLHRYGSLTLNFQMRVGAWNQLKSVAGSLDGIALNNSGWQHIAVQRIGKRLVMFVNGYQSGGVNTGSIQPVVTSATNLRIGDSSLIGVDEHRFQGKLDEMAIWKDQALSFTQIRDVRLRGLNAIPLALQPEITLAAIGTEVETDTANLSLNDCNGFTEVMILDAGAPVPGSGDIGWQTCNTDVGSIVSSLLNFNTTNNLTAYFKTGGVVDAYSYDFDVVHNQTDTTPPTSPTVTLETSTTPTSALAVFTVNSCSDIGGIFIGPTASTPTGTQDGWVNCSTINSATKYNKLLQGTNNISFWFKDNANNVSATTRDFTITFTEPVIAVPELYIPADNFYSGAAGAFDLANDNFFVSNDSTKIAANADSIINQSLNFAGSAYIEREVGSLALTSALTFSSWINISKPGIQSVILSKWDESAANDGYSIEVDTDGRLCFAMQTINSAGAGSWGSSSYRRSCSVTKVKFGQWNHISIVRNAGTVDFYINTSKESITTFDTGNFIASGAQMRIGGQDRGGVTRFTSGSIDEVSIWTTAFSQDQIDALYARGLNTVSVADVLQAQTAPIPYTYWTMDNANYAATTLTDLMANLNLDNTQSVSLTYAQDGMAGKVNEAFEYYNEEILESANANVDLATNFTISTIFSIADDTDDFASILSKSDNATNNEFQIYTDNKAIHVNFETTSATYAYTLPTSLLYDEWYNLIVIRNNTELKVFVNGALELFVTTIDSNPLQNTTEKVRIGADQSGSANYLSGLVDDTLLWKKSMDPSQAQYIYESNNQGSLLATSIQVSVAHTSNTVSTNTPNLTVSDCQSFTHVLVQADGAGAPAAGDGRWVACDETIGAIVSSTLGAGPNTLDIWFKNGAVVEGSETTEVNVNYTP
jgi:hypothetical protein